MKPELPENLKKDQLFDDPILTPTTKEEILNIFANSIELSTNNLLP